MYIVITLLSFGWRAFYFPPMFWRTEPPRSDFPCHYINSSINIFQPLFAPGRADATPDPTAVTHIFLFLDVLSFFTYTILILTLLRIFLDHIPLNQGVQGSSPWRCTGSTGFEALTSGLVFFLR